MAMSKAVEKRMWPFENPLKQFKLSQDVLYNIQRFADELSPSEIAQKTAVELGQLIHLNERHGVALLTAAQQFPSAVLTYSLRPLSADLLRICVRVTRSFEWNIKIHGNSEPFWIWVEDHDGTDILQWTHILLRSTTSLIDVEFVIPIWGQPPPSVTVRLLSDKWLGAEDEVSIPLRDLVMPAPSSTHTPRLDIPFLSLSVLQDANLESSYRSRESIRVLNDIQTQSFWTFYHTSQNVLLSAPSSCGKSISGHFAIW
jgi:antiviral helicase SLH1